MPCLSWSLPAQECKTGSKLRKIPNSVCSKCYAFKGNYGFPNVKTARYWNFHSLPNSDFTKWISEIVYAIRQGYEKNSIKFFRWFDSGDIQSIEHLGAIVEVCRQTPDIKHWLPTHEKGIVLRYLSEHSEFPENLTVRISAAMVDGTPTRSYKFTSTVYSNEGSPARRGHICPAPTQGNKCLDCRACWSRSVANIAYMQH